MRKIALVSLAALATALSMNAAGAQSSRHGYGWGGSATETPYIDSTQERQRARIEQGRRSGQLTRSEYYQLMEEQDRIAAMERRAKADGFADPSERRPIRDAQEVATRHIHQETHDHETRWNRWYRRWW